MEPDKAGKDRIAWQVAGREARRRKKCRGAGTTGERAGIGENAMMQRTKVPTGDAEKTGDTGKTAGHPELGYVRNDFMDIANREAVYRAFITF